MAIETVKGFRDVLPPESLKRQRIKEVIERNFKIFGFLPIETPTIEYEELAKGEDEKDSAVSERFRLKDRGGRELALRYEFTFQLKRIFKENPNVKLPFRRYQIGQVFRDEPIEKDRYREFIQCDADILGDASMKAEVDCLALADKICKELRIKYKLKVNNRKLLNSVLAKLGISNNSEILKELDKIEKIGDEEVAKNLQKYVDKKKIFELFEILENKLSFFIKEKYSGADELKELFDLCKIYGLEPEFSPFLVRGFAYYTGTIFEAYSEEIKGSIFAGGRFDSLVGKYINRVIPAVGISFGRIVDYPNVETKFVDCLVISINQDNKAIELMNRLRENDISCFMMDKLMKALEYANSYKIPFAVLVGEEEVKKKKFKFRDMSSGKEEMLSEKELVEKIK